MPNKRRILLSLFSLLAICLFISTPAHAQGNYHWSIAAQATPDECFQGDLRVAPLTPEQVTANNDSFNRHYPAGLSATDITNCVANGGRAKVNQAYVWGLTMHGNNLWFGTVANTLCLVLDSYYGSVPTPFQNDSWLCDMQDGEDVKPPRMFVYNSATGNLTDLTPRILLAGGTAQLTRTIGIRSAGNFGGVVFFGGLLAGTGGKSSVILYAFNAETQQYLGSYVFDGSDAQHPLYTNIRQWHVVSNQLFTGVAQPGGGSLLRWTGSLANPFSFELVGQLEGDPAYFTEHKGRIYVSTWGSAGKLYGMSIYMSPELHGETGLNAEDAPNWAEVWNLDQYEVEPAAVQAGGAIASFGGYLYWGTMHVPGTGMVAFQQMYPGAPLDSNTFINTTRSITIFRSPGFELAKADGEQPSIPVDLLYGSAQLQKYDPATSTWTQVPNNMGQSPLYGSGGFGNVFNNYTWAMEVFDGKLYVGTMDWSYLANTFLEMSGNSSLIPDWLKVIAPSFYGADLWAFPDANSAAVPISINGMGNNSTYGIRTMVSSNDMLWIGMANPMNLRTDSTDNPGGWKLLSFPVQDGRPQITWFNPPDISYGTPLSAAHLNATADVSGTFTYSPIAGTVLAAGDNQILSATFTPTNSGNQFSKTVTINVKPAATLSSVTVSKSTMMLKDTVTFTAHVASSTIGIPGGTVTFSDGGTSLGSATIDASGNASLAVSTLAAGPHSIVASYGGAANYSASASAPVTTTVQDFQFAAGSGVLSASVTAGQVANYSFTLSPTFGGYFPNDVTLALTGHPSGSSYSITPSTIPTGNGSQIVSVQVQTGSVRASKGTSPFNLTVFALMLLPLGMVGFYTRRRGIAITLLVVLAAAMLVSATGCGNSSTPAPPAPQNYKMTVTATSGTLQHTVNLDLTVQ